MSGYLYPRSFNIGLALIAVVIGLMTTGVTEWVREAVRKPYIIYGYNGIRVMVKGWPRALIRYSLDHLDELKGFMPPFVGSNTEREALTDWLYAIGQPATPSAAQRVSSRFPVPAQVWAQIHGELRGAETAPGRRKPCSCWAGA